MVRNSKAFFFNDWFKCDDVSSFIHRELKTLASIGGDNILWNRKVINTKLPETIVRGNILPTTNKHEYISRK